MGIFHVKIKKSDLASVVAGLIPGTDDNVFIVYHRKGDGYILAARMCEWPTLQAEGNVADGVMVCGGTKSVIVAPTEAAETMPLCKSAVLGRREIGEKKWAMADWDGKENTAEQVKHPECSGTGYAPGFCHAYSRMNPDNNGYGAGEWWLPSLAEMILIYQHFDLVNKALSMINGATQLITSWYWSSTEYAKDTKWNIGFGLGDLIGRVDGVEGLLRVRPVTSMVENVPISSKDVGRIYGELDRGEKVKISKADLASIVAGLMRVHHYDFSIAPKETKKIPMASMGLLIANNGMVSGHCIIASMSNLGIIPSFNPESSGFEFTENPIKHVGVYVKRGESDLYMKNAHETLSMPIKMVVIGVGKF